MPSKVDDQIPRSVMFLCLGTAMVLLLAQWGNSVGLFSFRHKQMGIVRANRRSLTSMNATNAANSVLSTNATNSVPSTTTQTTTTTGQPTTSPPKAVSQTDTQLVVSLSDRKVSLYKAGKVQGTYPLAVAQAGWETPTGTFQVLNKEQNPTFVHPITGEEIPPGTDNPLGVAWIGFWTDGESEIGFHGTNQEELIGEAVSHGCLRMRNADIEAIYALVSEGTPVVVQQ